MESDVMEFVEAKRRKERGVSNVEFYEGVKEVMLDAEQTVVISQMPDGRVETYMTADTQTEALGMMEIAKIMIVDDMTVYE